MDREALRARAKALKIPMRVRLPIPWLTAFVICLATAAQGRDEGEHFVTPYVPSAEEWEVVSDPARPTTHLWKNKQNEKDQYRLEVLLGSEDQLIEARMTLDGPGKANCTNFDTTTIRESRVNGYPRLLWRTDCTRGDDSKSTLLNLAVRGRESLYLAMKIWQFEVADSELDAWVERFGTYFVCDTRRPDQTCPQ